jgi:hypothetical protein
MVARNGNFTAGRPLVVAIFYTVAHALGEICIVNFSIQFIGVKGGHVKLSTHSRE